ncbi:response regulator [candidate division FCPU426 bacterium]|nr:response regulator [candidate division FCPU426 bacterium]
MAKKILIVDDEPAIGRLLKMTLSVEGYDVHTATSGFEALEQAASWKPQLVVLDVMMPGLHGYDVCRKLKAESHTKGIKIIFLTARGNPADVKEGFAVGGDDYIVKPFDPEELLEKVKVMMGPMVV